TRAGRARGHFSAPCRIRFSCKVHKKPSSLIWNHKKALFPGPLILELAGLASRTRTGDLLGAIQAVALARFLTGTWIGRPSATRPASLIASDKVGWAAIPS